MGLFNQILYILGDEHFIKKIIRNNTKNFKFIPRKHEEENYRVSKSHIAHAMNEVDMQRKRME